jgi:hypothetical protein
MSEDAWVTLIGSVVVPLVVRIAVHRWPWLAEPVADTRPPRHERPATDEPPPSA